MDVHGFTTIQALTYACGSAAGLSAAWLTIRGWSLSTPPVPDAVAAATLLTGRRDAAATNHHLRALWRIMRRREVVASLRLPTSMPTDGAGAVPDDIMVAYDVLREALKHPEAPHWPLAEFMRLRRSGKRPQRPGAHSSRSFEDGPDGHILFQHAWWETVLLELMVRCREAGSWVSPGDLDPYLGDRPDIAAALRSGKDGTVSPLGAGIVAHWQAEKAARTRLRLPKTDAALAAIETDAP